jgi:hypothetical protein
MDNYREYRNVRKRSGWPSGEWDSEPDKAQWIDEATGLDCLIVRNRHGALCGYVGVDGMHPWYGHNYSNDCTQQPACGATWCGHAPDCLVDVHGGLTFSSFCDDGGDERIAICHVPAPGRPDRVWWFGFDCWHSGDFAPGDGIERGGHYRGWGYVRRQVEQLAAQIKAVA